MGFFSSLFGKSKGLKVDPSQSINCPQVSIVYGTKTGNAQLVAQQAQQAFAMHGITAEVLNIARYDINRLFSENLLLIVMSTDGEGEVPPNTRKFFSQLNHNEFPRLDQLRYAMCALGDSSYEHFCGAGHAISQRLTDLGAFAALPIAECDLDYKETALDWIQSVYQHLTNGNGQALDDLEIKGPEMIEAMLLERQALTKGDDKKATYHVVVDNSSARLAYKAGDCIEILPQNPQQLVEKVLKAINAAGHEEEKRILQFTVELTRLTRKVVRNYQSLIQNEDLLPLINDKEQLNRYVDAKDVLDLVVDYPGEISVSELKSVLQPLNSRYYSIASGELMHPDQVHLTIKTIRFETDDRAYEGAGSVYMNEGLQPGSTLGMRLVPNSSFYLPNDPSVPVILIGVGTGIAPYRAFLQNRQAAGSKGKTWLIWGDKHREKDYLYESELKSFVDAGVLTRVDVVFSRDQAEKVYVQDVLHQQKELFLKWIGSGAHVYLCGHTRMGHSVRQTMSDIWMQARGLSKEQANDELVRYQEEGRLHEDLY